jgi:DNA-binding transcriptional LysR family regulator
MNWDDVRFFLELARKGSARSAGASLGLSHTTVARRAKQLESTLGTQLFDRDVGGYRLTGAGESMLKSAEQAEDALLTAERQLQGRDAELRGDIRLTTSTIIATYLMMPDLVKFSHQYPDINLEILVSQDVFDLTRREADIAIRFFSGGRSPPDDLVGRKLVSATSCYYASNTYLDDHNPWEKNSDARWIGWDDRSRFPEWVKSSPFPHIPAHGKLNDPILQVEAARAGMGLAFLPCFLADQIENLSRIPGCQPFSNYDIWLLSHPDLRDAARLRTFRRFIVDLFEKQKPLLTGFGEAE